MKLPGLDCGRIGHIANIRHPTLADAQAACFELGALCSGIYNRDCKDPDYYHVCKVGSFRPIREFFLDGCVYTSSNQTTHGSFVLHIKNIYIYIYHICIVVGWFVQFEVGWGLGPRYARNLGKQFTLGATVMYVIDR